MAKKTFQIPISPSERSKLLNRIEQDFLIDKASHVSWAKRCAGWMQKWEARVGPASVGNEDKPNHVVPLIQWQCFNKMARDIQSLLGDDAEVTAKASGPTDQARVRKVGRYMTSRLFDQMEIINPLCEFEFRRILNGWSAAYRPWWRREFDTLVNGERKRVCDFEGPGFFPLEPDDLMIPAERGPKSLQQFSHVIRRVPVTVDDLVRGDGTLYQGTSDPDFIKKLIQWAQQGPFNYYTMVGQDPVRHERELSEGVDYDAFMLGRRTIWLWEWYGYWRPLKKGVRGAEEDNLEKREKFEADFVVKMIPGMKEIVGVQDLLYLYPKMRKRRPFVESTLIKDGTYRPKGFGALLEDIEHDLTANSRLFQAAGELSVWPIVFFKPGGAMQPGIFKLEPGTAYATEDPAGVNVVRIQPNLEFAVARQQDLLTTSERVTNINDQSMGRSMSQPNAPKTATGQLALIEEGNVRAYLDSTILREDWEQIIEDFWDLDCDLVPKTQPGLFFRVTKEQAGGVFDVKQGGAYMTPEEFGDRYDFKLKFATSIWARQAKKAEFFGFYQAAMMNPIVAQNPKALWVLLNRLAQECGIDDFENVIPAPVDLDTPKEPDQEWSEMLEGDVVHPNPSDNDQRHLLEHRQQLDEAKKDPNPDKQAVGLLVHHILETQEQLKTKQLMQTLAQGFVQAVAARQGSGAPPNYMQQMQSQFAPHTMPPGAPGQPPDAAPAPGDIPPPPAAVGAQNAPQPQDGQL